MVDSFGRTIEYMRISITDRCNLRCRYCMPAGTEGVHCEEILSYEEIAGAVKAAAQCGIKYIKITGGEPLVRRDAEKLVSMIKETEGIEAVTMTTNGVLLKDKAQALKDAGLDAVNISIDTLDKDCYKEITGFDCLENVLEGIDEAIRVGLRVKINAVVLEKNIDECVSLIKMAEDRPVDVRFIEMMPLGEGRNFEAISCDEVKKRIERVYPDFKSVDYSGGYGPAEYYRIDGFKGNIGFINAVHNVFCENCNRIRLTSSGFIKACLCYDEGENIREPLREGRDGEVKNIIERVIGNKPLRHCFDDADKVSEIHDMFEIGG